MQKKMILPLYPGDRGELAMIRKGFLFLLLIAVVILFGSTSCQKLESTGRAGEASAPPKDEKQSLTLSQKWQQMLGTDINTLRIGDTKAGKDQARAVHVVSFHPQGQVRKIDEVDEINITFSEPVAPLQKITKDQPSLISVKPAVKGEGFWKSSTTYTFRIDEKLKLSSRYMVNFKGYTSFSGKKIDGKEWAFTTPTITILRTKPYHRTRWQTLEQLVLVRFSQDVDPVKIKPFIRITSPQGDHDFNVSYSSEKERKLLYYYGKQATYLKQYITLSPIGKYPIASNIKIQFLLGLPSMEGNAGLLKPRELQFRTYEIFKISSVSNTFNPDRGITVKLTNPVNIKHFIDKISFQPAVELNKGGNWNSDNIQVLGNFQPGTTYIMTAAADLTDQFGNQLGEQKSYTSYCNDYTPYLYPPGYNHFVFEDYLDKKMPINVRNIFQTKVSYKPLDIADLKTMYTGWGFDPKKMQLSQCESFDWKLPVVKNRNYTLGFDLDSVNMGAQGFYFIYFSGATRYHYPGHVFQLTDVAMVAKYSPSQIFLIPFNMKTGQLIPGLDFTLTNFAKGKSFSDSLKGGDTGIAIYEPGEDVLANNNLQDLAVSSQPKKSFIWGRKYEMFDMWSFRSDGYLDYNYNPSYFYNHLFTFTDKHLYKGGQTVKFKGIIRQILSGDMEIPTIEKIGIQVYNSRNQSVSKFNIDPGTVTAYGSFAGKFQLPTDAPTGFYRINFNLKLKRGTVSQSLTFSVQEYKPAKFEVKVSTGQRSIVAGESVSGNISGRYLFGTPMKQAKGQTIWIIQNVDFTPPGWDKYTFGTYDSRRRETIFKKDFDLDDNGIFQFKRDALTLNGKNSARLTIHGEVNDKDNNRIASSGSLLVHRGQYYIGLKTGSYFFKQGKPGTLQMVTVNPKGALAPGTNVNLKIVREEWKSFQKKDASGALRWDWKKLSHDEVTEDIELANGQVEKEFTFDKPGYYKVFLTGKDKLDNTVTTTGYFYVTGSGYVSWGVNEGRTIDLVTDKKEYKHGESVEVLIKSPFETATALVTVEREKVMWSKIVQMKGNANTVNIPVQKEFMPNAYINVIILKERTGLKWDENGKDIGKPEFYAGYREIKVDASEKHLNVNIDADRQSYEPGDTVTLDVTVTDKNGSPLASEVCLSVVDKGVLNLVGYELPDPFTFFWRNRPLDVKTVSTFNDILGRKKFKEKGENPGGDGGGSAYGSVVVRKNFKESAYYTAFIVTNAQGKAKVTFKLPDNLTTFKAMAVAGTMSHKFGRGSHDLMVKKNIILKPAVPNFSRPGDRYSAGVTVTNNSNQKLKIGVTVDAENVERIKGDKNLKKITLTPGQTEAVWFRFKVPGIHTQKLTFKAVSGRFSDGLYVEIPVRLPQFVEAAANFGRVDQKPVTERLIVPDGTLRELDKAEITLASSAMVGVKRNFDVLQEYPYDCLEQRLSKQFPLLAAGDFLLTYGLLDMKPESIRDRVSALLKKMKDYQAGSGGFKYYPDCIIPSEYLTCYAVEFIIEAKKRGYHFDNGMLTRAKSFLKSVALRSVDFKYPYSRNVSLLVQSYAVYVLSMDGQLINEAVNNLFEVRDRLPFPAVAHLVRALDSKHNLPAYMQPVLAKTMLNKMKDEPTMIHFENHEDESWWWVHGSNVKTTAIVLDALLEVYGQFPYAEKIARWLTTTTNQMRYLSTQDHIRLFMAFEHYYRVFEKDTPDFVANVLFNGLPKIKETFSGRELTAKIHNIPLNSYSPGKTIDAQFEKEGTGMLYYLLRLKYYPIGPVQSIDRGFKVTKVYKHLDGTAVTDFGFKAGEKYLAEVTVETKMERPFVMLDDPLPAGLKVLNPSFKTGLQPDMEKGSRDSQWGGYWGNFFRSEIYFDRVQVFADYLRRGTHKWTYLVIATNAGEYTVPNTVVSEMYNPEVFGRNDNRKVTVK